MNTATESYAAGTRLYTGKVPRTVAAAMGSNAKKATQLGLTRDALAGLEGELRRKKLLDAEPAQPKSSQPGTADAGEAATVKFVHRRPSVERARAEAAEAKRKQRQADDRFFLEAKAARRGGSRKIGRQQHDEYSDDDGFNQRMGGSSMRLSLRDREELDAADDDPATPVGDEKKAVVDPVLPAEHGRENDLDTELTPPTRSTRGTEAFLARVLGRRSEDATRFLAPGATHYGGDPNGSILQASDTLVHTREALRQRRAIQQQLESELVAANAAALRAESDTSTAVFLAQRSEEELLAAGLTKPRKPTLAAELDASRMPEHEERRGVPKSNTVALLTAARRAVATGAVGVAGGGQRLITRGQGAASSAGGAGSQPRRRRRSNASADRGASTALVNHPSASALSIASDGDRRPTKGATSRTPAPLQARMLLRGGRLSPLSMGVETSVNDGASMKRADGTFAAAFYSESDLNGTDMETVSPHERNGVPAPAWDDHLADFVAEKRTGATKGQKAQLMAPGEALPPDRRTDLHHMLHTLEREGAHRVQPATATMQAVCAVHVYGSGAMRSTRLKESRMALERVVPPVARNSPTYGLTEEDMAEVERQVEVAAEARRKLRRKQHGGGGSVTRVRRGTDSSSKPRATPAPSEGGDSAMAADVHHPPNDTRKPAAAAASAATSSSSSQRAEDATPDDDEPRRTATPDAAAASSHPSKDAHGDKSKTGTSSVAADDRVDDDDEAPMTLDDAARDDDRTRTDAARDTRMGNADTTTASGGQPASAPPPATTVADDESDGGYSSDATSSAVYSPPASPDASPTKTDVNPSPSVSPAAKGGATDDVDTTKDSLAAASPTAASKPADDSQDYNAKKEPSAAASPSQPTTTTADDQQHRTSPRTSPSAGQPRSSSSSSEARDGDDEPPTKAAAPAPREELVATPDEVRKAEQQQSRRTDSGRAAPPGASSSAPHPADDDTAITSTAAAASPSGKPPATTFDDSSSEAASRPGTMPRDDAADTAAQPTATSASPFAAVDPREIESTTSSGRPAAPKDKDDAAAASKPAASQDTTPAAAADALPPAAAAADSPAAAANEEYEDDGIPVGVNAHDLESSTTSSCASYSDDDDFTTDVASTDGAAVAATPERSARTVTPVSVSRRTGASRPTTADEEHANTLGALLAARRQRPSHDTTGAEDAPMVAPPNLDAMRPSDCRPSRNGPRRGTRDTAVSHSAKSLDTNASGGAEAWFSGHTVGPAAAGGGDADAASDAHSLSVSTAGGAAHFESIGDAAPASRKKKKDKKSTSAEKDATRSGSSKKKDSSSKKGSKSRDKSNPSGGAGVSDAGLASAGPSASMYSVDRDTSTAASGTRRTAQSTQGFAEDGEFDVPPPRASRRKGRKSKSRHDEFDL